MQPNNAETMGDEMEQFTKELFYTAMKGNWEQVVKRYKEDRRAHKARITRAGDTALHVAVSDCQDKIVEQLVDQIVMAQNSIAGPKASEILKIENDRGNTPLHFAASMGNVRMCKCIADVDPTLVGARNKESETPLFLAALRGKKDAFLCLHYLCGGSELGASYCRREDGQTALHCAIAGGYYDLAFQIIQFYEKLVNFVDQQGLSPLHILASKPLSFKSGSNLTLWQNIIYHCTFVDELKPESADQLSKKSEDKTEASCPKNYKLCLTVFELITKAAKSVTIRKDEQISKKKRADAENPADKPIIALHRELTVNRQNPEAQGHQLLPANYVTCFNFIKLVFKAALIILGKGSRMIYRVREKKEKHIWSEQIMNELLKHALMYEYEYTGARPAPSVPSPTKDGETKPYEIVESGEALFPGMSGPPDPTATPEDSPMNANKTGNDAERNGNKAKDITKINGKGESCEVKLKETAILIAAKNGVTEMVERILELFPVAIHDRNAQKKNIVLLCVEHRQPHVYRLLLKRNILKDSVFQQVDNHGNSALHLAAMLGDYKPWLIPGAALQMQWELKWFEFVKQSMPANFFVRYNNAGKTAKDLFTETHSDLVRSGGAWLTNTSESCSLVAALIATVAFATSATVPGGNNETSGKPTLENKPAFELFAIASLVALSFSVTGVVMFLAILTSRYQEKDFARDLPRKLLVGLTSLFVSIGSMLVSFCAGHFFMLQDKLKYAAFPVYAVTCLPVSFFALAQFPLYFDLIWANFKKVPQRSFKSAT